MARLRRKVNSRMFDTRSEAWAAVGLELELNRQVIRRALARLPVEVAVLVLVIMGRDWAGRDGHLHGIYLGLTIVKVAAVFLVLLVGWLIARDLARASPVAFRRMDPATAGTVEFLIRLLAVVATVLGGLAVGGISLQALAVGGAFTAVVLGIAAQQPLGNLFAGMVLLSARPFRLGERVKLQAGQLAGGVDGVVTSLGLLYTTLSRGDERVMVPNTLVLSAAILPLREPDSVDVRVTLASSVRPSHVQAILDANISIPTRKAPSVLLEEIAGATIVVRVQATPERHTDGARLADEIIAALVGVTGKHARVDAGAPRS